MKKRLLAIVCVILLCMMNIMTVFASGENPPRVVDEEGLLSSSEIEQLQSKVDRISDKYDFDVVVVTTDTANGASDVRVPAADFYENNGYRSDGVVLMLFMTERKWAIVTSGKGDKIIAESERSEMENAFVSKLTSGDYFEAFDEFADMSEGFLKSAKNAIFKHIFLSIVIGAILSFIVVMIMKRQLKSVRAKAQARDYVRQGSFNLTNQRDMFLYSNVVSRPKPKENSGGGGGSFTSSSGSSHGGSSGSF